MGQGMPRVIGRSDKEGFTVALGWMFHSASGFSLLDHNP